MVLVLDEFSLERPMFARDDGLLLNARWWTDVVAMVPSAIVGEVGKACVAAGLSKWSDCSSSLFCQPKEGMLPRKRSCVCCTTAAAVGT